METLLEWGRFAHSSTRGGVHAGRGRLGAGVREQLSQAPTHLRPDVEGRPRPHDPPPPHHGRPTGLPRDSVTSDPGDFRALGPLLGGGGAGLKIHLWEAYHDSKLVSLETGGI